MLFLQSQLNNNKIHCISVVSFFTLLYILYFSPVLFTERLLAPGDGAIYYLPAFHWNYDLWNQYIFSGYPQFGDPQAMMWYLPRAIFKFVSWNLFVLYAYISASSFTYGYVYSLTRNKFAALFSGIVYGMSGFFIAHLGHTSIIHAASWLPLIIWGLHQIKQNNRDITWYVVTSIAIAQCIFSGHPQIATYSLGLGVAYVLFMSIERNKLEWGFILNSCCIYCIGILLASIQLIPTIELSSQTLRSDMDMHGFQSYSLPFKQIIELLFPYIFGAPSMGLYNYLYFGEWNLTELTGYVGITPLILVAVYLIISKKINRGILFWLIISCLSLLLTLGDFPVLGKIMYYVPGYNLFRAQARNFMEFSFAISIISGICLQKIYSWGSIKKINKRQTISSISIVLILLIGILLTFKSKIMQALNSKGLVYNDFFDWNNTIIAIPIIISLLSITIIIWFINNKNKSIPSIVMIILLLIDLSSFGWFYEWKPRAFQQADLSNDLNLTLNNNQRIAILNGSEIGVNSVRPNLSQLFKYSSISGYDPLVLTRYNQFVGMWPHGGFNVESLMKENRSLDLLSVQKQFISTSKDYYESQGIKWSKDMFAHYIDKTKSNSISFNINNISSDKLFVVTSLASSLGIIKSTEVAKIEVVYSDNSTDVKSIMSGRDTSEWAYDRADVKKVIQQDKATVFESFSLNDAENRTFEGHRYLASFELSALKEIKGINIIWVGPEPAGLGVNRITLYNSKLNEFYPITPSISSMGDQSKWNFEGDVGSNTQLFENKNYLPRAWFVNNLQVLNEQQILEAVKHSNLPNGEKFDPRTKALIEEKIDFTNKSENVNSQVKTIQIENDTIKLNTMSTEESYLILSEIYYPGWKAYIDGVETKINRTDSILRGLVVPTGDHSIELIFKPKSLIVGLWLTLLGLLILIIIVCHKKVMKWFILKKREVSNGGISK